MKYKTIYADPPWAEAGGGVIKRGADAHYNLMKTREICALPVKNIIEKDAHLYLWVTNNFMPDGLEVMKAWGFEYKTCITWVKDRFGLGQYFRGQTEHCLFGVRGFVPYAFLEDGKRAQGTTVIDGPRQAHSAKPAAMRRMIQAVSAPNYLEMFAREKAVGWDVWGNQVEGSVNLG